MAGACTVSDADGRRLPAWMLKSCSSIEVPKSGDRKKQAFETDKQPNDLDQTRPSRRKSGRQIKNLDTEDVCEHRALQRCQGREKDRRKISDVDHTVKDDAEETEKITTSVRKVSGRAAPKNSRKRKLENVISKASSSGTTDDEIELTVEDLVSIAEEIVTADKEKQQELQSAKIAQFEEHPPYPPIFTTTDTRGSVSDAGSMKGLMRCTTYTTTSGYRVDKNIEHEKPQHSSSFETTGDVCQDMLNIFLGPRLRKPAVYEKKLDATESVTANANHASEPAVHEKEPEAIESVTMNANHASKPAIYEKKPEAIESVTMNANHEPQRTELQTKVQRQGEPSTKKKSSLKDKMALFL